MHLFQAESANGAWRAVAEVLLHEHGGQQQASRGGPTRELLHVGMEIRKPWGRWVTVREPAMNPAFALAEVLWIVSGRNDSAFVNYWNPLLPKFAGGGATYYGAYGFRLRSHYGLDQIERAYHALRNKPESRQVVLSIWDPRLDLPEEDGTPKAEDIPCNVSSLLKVRGGRLDWVQIMRSNDLFKGLPHNIVQFTYLQEMMAAWLGVEVGTYTHFSDSLHIYEDDLQTCRVGDGLAVADPEPLWSANYSETQTIIGDLVARMDELREESSDQASIRRAAEGSETLPAFASDILLVVAADAARRHGYTELAMELMDACTNSTFRELWRRWFERQSGESGKRG